MSEIMSAMEEMRKKVKKVSFTEFAIKDPAALELYGTTVWMVDIRAAKAALARHGLAESQWRLFWAACEERVEWANDRETGLI